MGDKQERDVESTWLWIAKILRYWAKGPDGTRKKLVDNPWEEVDIWIRGYIKTRQSSRN